jgi:N utilization substance protein B
MATRRRAREVVLQCLYARELNPGGWEDRAPPFLKGRLIRRPLIDFAGQLLAGVQQHLVSIDQALERCATNWSLRRMAVIDRNILRLGAFELLHTETPARVVINEAIEIAKRYGDRHSAAFVNGVLDRLHKQHDSEAPARDTGSRGGPPLQTHG